jgi:CheY-like chemotaxis protein
MRASMATSRGLAPLRVSPTRVLVVDDDAEYRLAMRAVLERHGCEVFEAENGLVALHVCRTVIPSIILLDVVMPVMTGTEFLTAKQADSRITYIPVIVISSTDIGTSSRVVRQLRKQVGGDDLMSIIRVVVGASRRAP